MDAGPVGSFLCQEDRETDRRWEGRPLWLQWKVVISVVGRRMVRGSSAAASLVAGKGRVRERPGAAGASWAVVLVGADRRQGEGRRPEKVMGFFFFAGEDHCGERLVEDGSCCGRAEAGERKGK